MFPGFQPPSKSLLLPYEWMSFGQCSNILCTFYQSTTVISETRADFGHPRIKANALIYCHRHCNSVMYTYSISVDSQSFKPVHCSIWQVLIYLPCSWRKHIYIQDHPPVFSQKYHEHVISFCITPKHSKTPFSTSRKAQRGSLCINFKQQGCESEVECLIIPHLTQCHCRFTTAKINCLHLFSKVKLMSDAQ